jgi:hypothetical protein
MDIDCLIKSGAEPVVTVGVTIVAALFIALSQFSRINGGSLKSVQSYVLFRRVIRWPMLLVSFGLYICALIAVKVCPHMGLGLFFAGTYGFVSVGVSMYKWISSEVSDSVFSRKSYSSIVTSDFLLGISLRAKIECAPLLLEHITKASYADKPLNTDARFVANYAKKLLTELCLHSDGLDEVEVHNSWWWVIRLAEGSQHCVEEWLSPDILKICSRAVHAKNRHSSLSRFYSRQLIERLLVMAATRRRIEERTRSPLANIFDGRPSEITLVAPFCAQIIESPIDELKPFESDFLPGSDLDRILENQCIVNPRIWGEAIKLLGEYALEIKSEFPSLVSAKNSMVLSPILKFFLAYLLLETVSREKPDRDALACAITKAFGDIDCDRLFLYAYLEKLIHKNGNVYGILRAGVPHYTSSPVIESQLDFSVPDYWSAFHEEIRKRTDGLSEMLFIRLHNAQLVQQIVSKLDEHVQRIRADYYLGIEYDWRFYEKALAESKAISSRLALASRVQDRSGN